MEIKKGNMLYALFMWCLSVCERATYKWYLRDEYKHKTNLCHFVRVICLYTPLIIISNLVLYIMAASVVILPFFLFGLSSIGFFLLVALCIVTGFGIIIGLTYLFAEDVIQDWFRHNETCQVISEYIKAKKASICPYIYFKGVE